MHNLTQSPRSSPADSLQQLFVCEPNAVSYIEFSYEIILPDPLISISDGEQMMIKKMKL